jgi:MoxR-like ATPase
MDQRLLAIVRSAPVRDQKGRTLDRMPDGRWPAEHALTLMQQVAVNQAMDSLTSGGIFSINGPPGTGKTTLLMDVVAALVARLFNTSSFRQWQADWRAAANAKKIGQVDLVARKKDLATMPSKKPARWYSSKRCKSISRS